MLYEALNLAKTGLVLSAVALAVSLYSLYRSTRK